MELDRKKEENWVKAILAKLTLSNPSSTMNQLVTLLDDQKLKEATIITFLSTFEPIFDPEEKREFLPCEYYRVNKSYRSALSNKYYPKTEEAARFPTELMRNTEISLNKFLPGYLNHYYPNSIGSAYAFEKESLNQYHIIILITNSIF